MSKTSRIILWCVMAAVLALCVVLYISTKQTAADTTARDAGKRYAESLQAGDETPVITGGDFTITAHTFENMCAQNRASGMTEAEAAQYTLARYIVTRSLYDQAVAEGYAAADAAVQQDIDDTRAAAQTADNRAAYEQFLAGTGMTETQIARVAYLVGHHHTLRDIHGMDYQILIEADYIANASENGYAKESVIHFLNTIMKTASGRQLAASVLGISATDPGCADR